MVQKLKTLCLSLFFFLCSFWGAFQLPCTQRMIQEKVSSFGGKIGLTISYKSLDFTLPFCFRCTDLSITTATGEPVVNCPSIAFTPLLVDLPWRSCTLLYLYAQDLSINLDNLPKKNLSGSDAPPWTFSMVHFSFPSLTCTGAQTPNGLLQLSVSGKACALTNGDDASLDIRVTRNNPQAWPKEWCLEATKKGFLVDFEGSCALRGSVHNFLFSQDDYLSFCGNCSLSPSSNLVVKEASCRWAVCSTSLKHSLAWDVFLEHSVQGKGSVSYDETGRFDGTIDSAQVQILLQKPSLNSSFAQIKRQKISLNGQFAASPVHDGLFRLEASLPNCSVNDFSGAFSVSADIDPSNSVETTLKAILSGSFSNSHRTIPILGILTTTFGGTSPTGDLTVTSSPIVAAFHFQKNDTENSIVANIRCLNLSALHQNFARGEAEIFAQFATNGGKKPLTLTVRVSDLSICDAKLYPNKLKNQNLGAAKASDFSDQKRPRTCNTEPFLVDESRELWRTSKSDSSPCLDIQDGTFSCSSTDILREPWSIRADCIGLCMHNLFLTKAQSSLSYTPSNHSLVIHEISLLGKQGQLPFNLLANGTCLLQKSAISLSIDSIEGTLEKEEIKFNHPLQIDLKKSLSEEGVAKRENALPNDWYVHANASIRIGKECLITGQWLRPSQEVALSELNIERLPVHILSLALNTHISTGTVSGFYQYKKTADDLVAKMHLDASKIRYGVVGAEGSELAIGIDSRIEKGTLSASLCAAGVGIKDPLYAEGKIPITHTQKAPFFTIDPNSQIQATLRGSIALSEFLTTWMPQHVHIEGTVLGDLTISGTLNDPRFYGPLSLRKGRIEIPTTAQVLDNIEMDGNASGHTVIVETIHANDEKEGTVAGHGTIGFNDDGHFAWETDLSSSHMEVVSLPYAKAEAEGKIHLQGDASTLQIIGNPIAKNAIIDLAARFPITIPEMRITYKDEQVLQKTPYTVTLHLGVDGQNGLLLRGRGLSSIWKGTVHIDGVADSLKMQGTLRCTEGSFMLGNKELCITEGTVGVHGNLFTDSKLHVIATIHLPDVVATVSLTGSLATPKISIQSTPMKPENEILSLVLFNKEYGDISPFESLQLAQTALQLKQANSPFSFIDKMKESLGIDVLDVNTSNLQSNPANAGALDPSDTTSLTPQVQNDVSLRVGKYISQGVAVVVSKDVTSDTNRLGIEAHIAQEITAAAEIGDDESGVVSLKWKKDY
jgi:hypothetical protein